MPLDAGPAADCEQSEVIVEPFQNLGQRQPGDAGRRQLNRQRDAIESAADLNDIGQARRGIKRA